MPDKYSKKGPRFWGSEGFSHTEFMSAMLVLACLVGFFASVVDYGLLYTIALIFLAWLVFYCIQTPFLIIMEFIKQGELDTDNGDTVSFTLLLLFLLGGGISLYLKHWVIFVIIVVSAIIGIFYSLKYID